VRLLSRVLGIPQPIIDKAPTADLWDGQTDEGELGITYPVLDEILYQLTEENLDVTEAAKLSFPLATYQHVQKLISRSEFKRLLPPVLEQ
jgi:NAD+ synthase